MLMQPLQESIAADFDAVIIPGGMAHDKMRTNMRRRVRFVTQECCSQDFSCLCAAMVRRF
jgi:enhancing lycopene biosynthesis protein 2